MEDVDTPRNAPGAADGILRALERFGFEWDGEVLYQSARIDAYRQALHSLRERNLAFPCACSRREIADSALTRQGGRRYPGTCRSGVALGRTGRAWRLRVDAGHVSFSDRLQGLIEEDVSGEVGDFVLLRADGVFAYQLTVVVDDAAQGVTEIVRGADLLDSTPRQIYLQRALGLATPAYCHVPVAVNRRGEKLSKQTRAPALGSMEPRQALVSALRFLGQEPPTDAAQWDVSDVWRWARSAWDIDKVPHARSLPAPPGFH